MTAPFSITRPTKAGIKTAVEPAESPLLLVSQHIKSKTEIVDEAFKKLLYKWLEGSPLSEGRIPNKDEAFYWGLFKEWPKPGLLPFWLKWSLIGAAVIGVLSTGYFLAKKIAG